MGALGSVFFHSITPIQKHPCLAFQGGSSGRNDQMPVHFTLKMEMDVPKKHCYHTSLSLRNTVCREVAHPAQDSAASADLSPKQRQLSQGAMPPFCSLLLFLWGFTHFGLAVTTSGSLKCPTDPPLLLFVLFMRLYWSSIKYNALW